MFLIFTYLFPKVFISVFTFFTLFWIFEKLFIIEIHASFMKNLIESYLDYCYILMVFYFHLVFHKTQEMIT